MPESKRINYGKKTMAMKDTDTMTPIMLLLDRDGVVQDTCYCSACCNTFKIPDYEEYDRRHVWNGDRDTALKITPDACPECGNGSDGVSVKMFVDQLPDNTGRDANHINYSNAYEIPSVPRGRYMFEYRDDDGNITRIDDNVMLHNAIIFPSGKVFEYDVEYSETMDFVKNQIRVSCTKITGDRREEQKVFDSLDFFKYPSSKGIGTAKWNINHARGVSSHYNGITVYNMLLEELARPYPMHKANEDRQFDSFYFKTAGSDRWSLRKYNPMDACTASEYKDYMDENDGKMSLMQQMDNHKYAAALSRFSKNVHPVYMDAFHNGMFLGEHHVGSNAGNTQCDEKLIAKYMLMLVKYPVAFEYACERTDMRVTDWVYAQVRKAKAAQPDVEPEKKDCPDTLRAKMFREEIEFICEQLASVDDKLLKTISSSKDVPDLRSKLAFYVFGKDGPGAEVPSEIKLKDNQTMTDPTTATKSLKREFSQNMIGVANTVYTCNKLGIKDINHVMSVVDIANNAPSIYPKRKRENGNTVYVKEDESMFRNAKTIVPVQDRSAMRFLKNYSNMRRPADFISEVYTDTGWSHAVEDIRMYENILTHADVANTKAQVVMLNEEIMKARMRNYLQQKTVKDAYVDFIEVFEGNTVKEVNKYVYMVKYDEKLGQMKADYDNRGLDYIKSTYGGVIASFPPYCDKSDGARERFSKKPDDYIKSFFDSYEPAGEEKKVIVSTRNGKPLFYDRNLSEIHDELIVMYDGIQMENTVILYDDDERMLEDVYDAPDVPGGKWTISLHKDTNEMIRTATELHNCLKSHTDWALQKRETLLFMRNELGEKVACISVKKIGDSWMCDECQGDHDTAIHERYAPVIRLWAEEHGVTDSSNRNLESMGKRDSDGNLIAFHGGGNADYHREEIDEATGSVLRVEAARDVALKRQEMAQSLYGCDDSGLPAVPDEPVFPDYLQ